MRIPPALPGFIALLIASSPPQLATAQTSWDPNAIPFVAGSVWQHAAVATLNRHLPTDSGFFVLGPLDLSSDLPDTLRLVETTLRIIAPNPRAARRIVSRLRLPTGGVALEDIQPSDTLSHLSHEVPPGYLGRFIRGTLVGEPAYVQVFTIQEHRWLLWAKRAQLTGVTERATGPLASYSKAVARYLAAVDSGRPDPRAPQASDYELDPAFDIYALPPADVIRGREGYLRLLDRNSEIGIDSVADGVLGFVPGPSLVEWLQRENEGVLFPNKEGEIALQHRYRDFQQLVGRWIGNPVLSAETVQRLRPGRYVYAVDRYGFMRVGRVTGGDSAGDSPSAALLMHGDPVLVAGELVLARALSGVLKVRELDINSEEYLFSNLSLSLYTDVEQRSDRYMLAVGYALGALDSARMSRDGILLRKF
ncbi:MAG: hypothetical protein V3U38_07185 [Gemmatimonadota bacterium]